MYPLLLSMLLASNSPTVVLTDDAPTARVSYHDLDLTTAKGARKLKLRLRAATDTMCRDNRSRDLETRRLSDECFAVANRDAAASYDAAVAAATPRPSVRVASK